MKKTTTWFSVFSLLVMASFTFSSRSSFEKGAADGLFVCNMNGKDIVLTGAKAQFRTITGGHKQLSLSNDKFEAFVFINPGVQKLDLTVASNRQIYVRYLEPGTNKLYKPVDGFVDIKAFDLKKGVVSGVFEMVLVNRDGPEKKITVKNGKFENIPIHEIKPY